MKKSSVPKNPRRWPRRCRHARDHDVIFNPTTGGQQLSVTWCWRCGAIQRSIGIPDGNGRFVYLWCGAPPKWEHPNGVNGTLRDAAGSVQPPAQKKRRRA